ncbi:MAG: tetratricopeptide repeat protein, partial [bacterium]
KVLKQDPNNYRALRLKSRAYFEQGKYKQAAKILTELAAQYAPDIGVKIDLVDAKLASGDWYQSTKILQEILQQYPNTVPAQERLRLLRREQSQAFYSNYEHETESGNFFKQIYNVVLSKVVYSFFHLKFLFGEETYSTKDFSFEDDKYLNLGVEVSSRYNSIGINAQKQQSEWNFSGKGMLRWYFSPSNYFTISSALNELWNDPLIATFYQGRRYNLKSDVNLYLLNRIFFWNRFSYESHSINKNKHFGDALRTYFQLGYVWRQRPQVLTYYQFYKLNYHYQNAANRNLILIRDRESVHYLGAALNQQLTSKLYYQLGGSIGFDTIQDNMLFYGTFDLEYMLMNRIRLRSHFVYGNQSRLAGNNINKSISFDLFYFY